MRTRAPKLMPSLARKLSCATPRLTSSHAPLSGYCDGGSAGGGTGVGVGRQHAASISATRSVWPGWRTVSGLDASSKNDGARGAGPPSTSTSWSLLCPLALAAPPAMWSSSSATDRSITESSRGASVRGGRRSRPGDGVVVGGGGASSPGLAPSSASSSSSSERSTTSASLGPATLPRRCLRGRRGGAAGDDGASPGGGGGGGGLDGRRFVRLVVVPAEEDEPATTPSCPPCCAYRCVCAQSCL
mmetsp:Transcript_20890/g.83251  ORF Transcript_20890/g.83251 Transcript_20890/m.83251 type:complete len:244 (+) Transcript_20890:847-1578(+)